jgi:5-methylcytosine-specific restriction endonuclease McrA
LSAGLPRPERISRILDRDGHECVWCRRPLAVGARDLSFEHVIPRLKGGPAWIENEVAACRGCNRRRGHRPASAYLEDCRARGLEPNGDAILAALHRLEEAIAGRGGQRRARPHLERELRRLGG